MERAIVISPIHVLITQAGGIRTAPPAVKALVFLERSYALQWHPKDRFLG
jgi:hypothetical protein